VRIRLRMSVALASICAGSLAIHLWGMPRELPYVVEPDEIAVVQPAVAVASGDWDPRTFLYPASTTIYPLALAYRLWNGAARRGPWLRADPAIERRFLDAPRGFYLLARGLSVTYAVTALVLVFVLGRAAFDASVGLLAAWFAFLSPLAVESAQIARTDSAGMFFTALALCLCLRLVDRPGVGRSVVAGAAIGLGVASRYFLMTLVPVLLAAQIAALQRQPDDRGSVLRGVGAGLLAVPAAFLVSTPFFLLDLPLVQRDLVSQSKGQHLGADGLSFAGNLVYYAREGMPMLLSLPLAILACWGAALAVARREPKPMLLVLAGATCLVGISLSSLHWARWLIEVLPVLSVLAAVPVVLVAREIPGRFLKPIVAALAVAALSAAPLSALGREALQMSQPSTRMLARDWIIGNLPAGAKLAQEWYTAPLAGAGFAVVESMSLARGKTLEWYRGAGIRYLVTSDSISGRYLIQPDRYPSEAAFYRALRREGRLLAEFTPSPTRAGSRISIYELPAAGTERRASP